MSAARVLAVVAPRDFRDEELLIPLASWADRLEVTVASTRAGVAIGMRGARVRVVRVREVEDTDFDAVVVVGGTGAPAALWDDAGVLRVVRRAAACDAVVAAICYGGVVLARAGVLAGRRATVYPDRRAELELARAGAVLVQDRLVTDGNVVTATGPADAGLLATSILTQLGA